MQHWKERLSFIKNVGGIREGWDPCLQVLECDSSDCFVPPPVKAVAFSPDGRALVSASTAGRVRLWDATTGTLKQTLQVEGTILDVAFLPDLNVLVSDSADNTVRLWDSTTRA